MIGSPPANSDPMPDCDVAAAFARLKEAGQRMPDFSYLSEMMADAARASGLDAWQLERLHDVSWAWALGDLTGQETSDRASEIRALGTKSLKF